MTVRPRAPFMVPPLVFAPNSCRPVDSTAERQSRVTQKLLKGYSRIGGGSIWDAILDPSLRKRQRFASTNLSMRGETKVSIALLAERGYRGDRVPAAPQGRRVNGCASLP